MMCALYGVTRGGFYAWQCRQPSARTSQDALLTERIRQIHRQSRGYYGSPRVTIELKAAKLIGPDARVLVPLTVPALSDDGLGLLQLNGWRHIGHRAAIQAFQFDQQHRAGIHGIASMGRFLHAA